VAHQPPASRFRPLTRALALTAAGGLAVLLVGCGNEPADPDAAPSSAVSSAVGSAVPGSASPSSPSARTTTSPVPTSPPASATPDDAVVIDIALENGTVSPNGRKIDVRKGQTVTLKITTDHDDEVHVHGDYDIELEVRPGTPMTKSFVADKTGSVEVESHHPEKIIAILNIR
jgi:hypothetical protein